MQMTSLLTPPLPSSANSGQKQQGPHRRRQHLADGDPPSLPSKDTLIQATRPAPTEPPRPFPTLAAHLEEMHVVFKGEA